MTLDEWAALHPEDLKAEAADDEAISELIAVASREIEDASSVRSPEGRLGHSHNAVLAVAAAALAIGGYRVRSGSRSHHFRLIESLQFTLGLDQGRIKELQDYRRKRSLSIYERTGVVTECEAESSLNAAKKLLSLLQEQTAMNQP